MESSFSGKVIAITGAASGIGLATAQLLASRGAILSLADINEDALRDAAAGIQKSTPHVQLLVQTVNVAKPQEVDEWIDSTVAKFKRLDGAANVAGTFGTFAEVQDVDDAAFDQIIDVNLRGTFYCLRAQLRHLADGGSIVNAASAAGHKATPMAAVYSASKGAIIALTKSVAIEVAERNIRVNCITPGPIDTPMYAKAVQSGYDVPVKSIPLNRIGKPEEVAFLNAFLMGDESKFITGSSYDIDGGWAV